jgi:hypothetical protein
VDIILIEPSRRDRIMFAENTMRFQTRMTIARHGFESVAQQLCEHYPYYRAMMARHGIPISDERIRQDLRNLEVAGNDPQLVRAALVTGGLLHPAPAGLASTLAELDRLLSRLEVAR